MDGQMSTITGAVPTPLTSTHRCGVGKMARKLSPHMVCTVGTTYYVGNWVNRWLYVRMYVYTYAYTYVSNVCHACMYLEVEMFYPTLIRTYLTYCYAYSNLLIIMVYIN